MELTGKIIAVLPANSGVSARTGNPWMSQEYVIEVPGQYPKKCVFRIFGEDRIKQFNIQQGEDLTVSFDIDAHEYNGRWFNEIRAYNVNRGVAAAPVLRSLLREVAMICLSNSLSFTKTDIRAIDFGVGCFFYI